MTSLFPTFCASAIPVASIFTLCLSCNSREATQAQDFRAYSQTLSRSPKSLRRRSLSTPPNSPSPNAFRHNSPLSESTRSPSATFNSEKLRMAFNFGASNPAGGSASAELGSELPDVFTDVCPTRRSYNSPPSCLT